MKIQRPPEIPSLSSAVPVEIRRAFDAIRTYYKGVSGRGGALTTQDMLDAGVLGPGGGSTVPERFLDTAVPPRLSGFTAAGALRSIILSWDEIPARNIAHVEIWRHTADDLGQAALVGTTNARVFADLPPQASLSVTYYYWGRAVNTRGIFGPWAAVAGTAASTATDPEYLHELLEDEILASDLHQTLRERINLVDDPTMGLVKKTNDLVATYGETAAAAASAVAAAASEAAAAAAKADAITKANEAAGYATNASSSATNASTSATSAGTSATTANTSATNAASSAGTAGTAATTSTTQAGIATTKAGEASTSASQSATSATNAAGSASSASTSATNASTSATGAGNSATAAASSASSASTSATNAATSASAASTAKLAAETAKAGAESAKTDAVTAKTSAEGSASSASTSATNAANSASASGGSATAAAGSASTATTKATEAGNSATAASAAKVSAESARDVANGSASAASTSATNAATSATAAGTSATAAAGSATTATTKASEASTSASQSSTSAGNAASSASTAATHASNASGSASTAATQASNASGSAASAAISASLSSAVGGQRVGNPFFEHGKMFWSDAYTGETVAELTAGTIVAGVGSRGGKVLEITGVAWVFSGPAIPVDTSRTYKARFRVRQTVNPTSGGTSVYAGVVTLDANYINLTGGAGDHRYCATAGPSITVADGWAEYEGTISGVGDAHNNFRAGTAYVRPMCLVNYNGGNGTAQIDALEFFDISEEAVNSAAIVTEQQVRADADSALSQSITTLNSTVGGHTTSIQTLASTTDGLEAQYVVKIDNNGFPAGIGLASEVVNGVPFSQFIALADRYSIINPNVAPKTITSITRSGTTATVACTAHGFATGAYVVMVGAAQGEYNGSFKITSTGADTFTCTVSGTPASPATAAAGFSLKVGGAVVPFIVDGGVVIMDTTIIKNGTIKSAQVESLAADKLYAVSGTLAEAIIGTGHITDLMIGNVIQSADGGATWQLRKDGGLDIRALTIRNADGTVLLQSGGDLDFSRVGGTTKPANNATVGAPIGTNVGSTPAGTVETNAKTGYDLTQNNATQLHSSSLSGEIVRVGVGWGALPASGADVTNYGDTRVANVVTENSILTVARPGGGSYSYDASITGAIKITLPQSWTHTMMRFIVDVYDFYGNKSFSLYLAGYNYEPASGWLNTSVQLVGNTEANNRVRFGHDGTKCCILIGGTTSVWAYPKVVVRDFQAGYSNNTADSWETGWAVDVVTSTTGITFTSDHADSLLDAKATKYVGNTLAGTVETNSANGATAFNGTVGIRNTGNPTNQPAFGTVGTGTATADGNVVIDVPYTYTQGAITADNLLVFIREGGGAVTAADPCYTTNPVSGSLKFTVKPSTTYSFGLQAIRRRDADVVGGAIVLSSNVTSIAGDYTGNVNGTAAATLVSNASVALSQSNSANAALADIASDAKFTPIEKQQVKREWDAIVLEKATLAAQGTALGITTEVTNFSDTFQSLANYLNNGAAWTSGDPNWLSGANMDVTTDIVGSTFRGNFASYYDKRQILLNKLAAVAATKADWSNVDNKTGWAALGTNKLNSSNISTYIADLAVNTLQIGLQQVTFPVYMSRDTNYVLTCAGGVWDTGWQTVFSQTFNSNQSPTLMLQLGIEPTYVYAQHSQHQVWLEVDGVPIFKWEAGWPNNFNDFKYMTHFTPATTNTTVTLKARIYRVSGDLLWTPASITIAAPLKLAFLCTKR